MALERIAGERCKPEAEENGCDGEARGVSIHRRGHNDETENRSDRGEQCDHWVSTPLGIKQTIRYYIWYYSGMGSGIEEILRKMRSNPSNIRFTELKKVCNHHFGEPRNRGSSHFIYKTPWPGDPRVNIQDKGGAAKPYQVRQVLSAIDHLRENSHER